MYITATTATNLQMIQPPGSNSGAFTTLLSLRIIALDSADAFLPELSLSLQCEQYQSSAGRHSKSIQAATISKHRNHKT